MEAKNGLELPLGFGLALKQNPGADTLFSSMSAAQQRAVIHGTHYIHTDEDMRAYVARLGQQELFH